MRGVGCLVVVVVALAFFVIPLTGCLSLALAILGVDPETAVPVSLLLAIGLIVWTGIKTFFR